MEKRKRQRSQQTRVTQSWQAEALKARARGIVRSTTLRNQPRSALAACCVFFRGQDGLLGEQLLFRSSEAELELVGGGHQWSFLNDAWVAQVWSAAK